jgi:Tfp pilus assembly protein PilF
MVACRNLALLLLLVSAAQGTAAAPYVPQSDGEVLERLPYRANDPFMREIRQLREAHAREPQDVGRAVTLARRYFEQARAEGDPRYLGYAQSALQRWWDLPEPPSQALVMRAALRQYRHDFAGALADLTLALGRDPGDAGAWSLRAVIHVVQGDYEASRRDCGQYASLVSELIAVGCIALVDGLTGHAREARERLAAALARATDASAEQKLWTLVRLAEMSWRLNEPRDAEQQFKAALALGLTDSFLLAAYADFLLDYGRPREVMALLADRGRSDPLLLRLALAEQAVGAPGLPAHRSALADRYAAARLRADTTHEQEESRFSLHIMKQADAALKLAQANWQVQREPRDARVLLEAALALRQPAAARDALDWMARSRIEDWYLERLAGQLAALKKDGA